MRIEEFGNQLNNILSCFPAMTTEEEGLAVHLYRLLARGAPVKVEKLAAAAGYTPEGAAALLREWPGVEMNDQKRVTGFWGLDLESTDHRFGVDGISLYTWCAWDAFFIPEILRKTALVESTCPESGEVIRLTVSPGKIESRLPARSVMSFIQIDPEKISNGIIANFCRYVHFFASREKASQWTTKNKGTFILSLDEAFDLARAHNAARFRRALDIQAGPFTR